MGDLRADDIEAECGGDFLKGEGREERREDVCSKSNVFDVSSGEFGVEKSVEDKGVLSGDGGGRVFRRHFRSRFKASSLMKQSPMSSAVFKLCVSADPSLGLNPIDALKSMAPGRRRNFVTSPEPTCRVNRRPRKLRSKNIPSD